jgi:single-strand DNA-binding protein
MSFNIEGVLHAKFDTEQKSNSFSIREFVLLTPGDYPQHIKFQLVQDKCALLDAVGEGTTLSVHFDLRGREYNGKYFTTLNAWKVEAKGQIQSGTGINGLGQPSELPF